MLSAQPMQTRVSMTPDTDLDRPLYTTEIRWEWPGGVWDRFRLVRRLHSPAARCEEGSVLFETKPEDWGDPVYEDPSPPPDRWVYYTAFILNEDRVWLPVGSTAELGTGDHDWTLNLPELLPGVSVSKAQQVVARADADQQVVEFLQGPGLVYDRVIAYGESMQHFWDPMKVPPAMLPALLDTVGIRLNTALSDARLREVAAALLRNQPLGDMKSVYDFAKAATGYPVRVGISNNMMLSPLDSSFEGAYRPGLATWTYADLLQYVTYQDVLDDNAMYLDLASQTSTSSYVKAQAGFTGYNTWLTTYASYRMLMGQAPVGDTTSAAPGLGVATTRCPVSRTEAVRVLLSAAVRPPSGDSGHVLLAPEECDDHPVRGR